MAQKAKVASAMTGPAEADDHTLEENIALRGVVHEHVDVSARALGRGCDLEREPTERVATGGERRLVRHRCRGVDRGDPSVLSDANRQARGLDAPRALVAGKGDAAGHGRASIPAPGAAFFAAAAVSDGVPRRSQRCRAGAPRKAGVGRGLPR